MTRDDVPLKALCETRERLVVLIREGLDADEKRFLVSMKQGEPEWDVLGIAHMRALPALQWKLQNIRRMETGKRKTALEKLQKALSM